MMYLDLLSQISSSGTLETTLRRIFGPCKKRRFRLPGFSGIVLSFCALFFISTFSPLFAQSSGSLITETPVFFLPGEREFNGIPGDHLEFPHAPNLELEEGTILFRFSADRVSGQNALFSKDASGQDVGGHLTALVSEGRLKVRLQSISKSEYVESASDSIVIGEEYHVAITFGANGFWLFLNGRLTSVEARFDQGIDTNKEPLAIGASLASRTPDRPEHIRDPFDGRISDFAIYGTQFNPLTIASAAGLENIEELAEPKVINGKLYGTDKGETLDASSAGVNEVFGGYGNDTIVGTSQNDVLQGGHGEDELRGGAGDDLIISYADSREPIIAQDYNGEDDPDDEINGTTRTLYPDQPIEGDDIMIGGPGADTFHFRVLINAKKHIILKHVRDSGEINWDGVAGENNNVHDHWVDALGDEMIKDFSRAEGDKIEVVGHTVEVYKIIHQDSDNDHILDSTVLHIRSNQGNGGGAHNRDLLGRIHVFGDLVTASDIKVEQKNYGIVPTIAQLEEALKPRVYTSKNDGLPPAPPTVEDGAMPENGVLHLPGVISFNGEEEDQIEVEHYNLLELASGTIALGFNADGVGERRALFSKDASGQEVGGHLTAFVREGRVEVRFQSVSQSIWLKSPEGSVLPNRDYHLAVTFGPEGFFLYLDGNLAAVDADFTQALEMNGEALVIGASIWGRSSSDPDYARDHFDGQIIDFTIFNGQYDANEVAILAGEDPPNPNFENPTVVGDTLYGTDKGEILDATSAGVTKVYGSYGDDLILGSDRGDTLKGGHGEDELRGGPGNDLLISYADSREPVIAQNYNSEDDPDDEINPNTRTLYPDQPIEGDDILIGGPGADTFHFRVLINAKRDIILKHVRSNGEINWDGVAGENNNVHDHWVDALGDEMIKDFNRAEGDKIEVVGHTVEVYKIIHQDSDNDGILDSTVLHIRSNQGNGGGAHNRDLLGTINVFGDLVTASDIEVEQKNYGIVPTISQLEEALKPRVYTAKNDGMPPASPAVDDGTMPENGVLHLSGAIAFNSEEEDQIEVDHYSELELVSGTVALRFNAEGVGERRALFSKDASGQEVGGHLTAFVREGRVEVRFQSVSQSIWLKSPEGSVLPNRDYHLAVTFGPEGFFLYLDGDLVAVDADFTQALEMNGEALVIGASIWGRSSSDPYYARDHFDGQIIDFTIFNGQYDANEVAILSGEEPPNPNFENPTVVGDTLYGTDKGEILDATSAGVTKVYGSYGDDLILGSDRGDTLKGGHGEDELRGGLGNDLLISYADSREPVIAQNYNSEDDPDDEINPNTRTLYPDQPIEGDDILIGGPGADTFHFRVLINAKRHIILKHVRSNGEINWDGVAGENNNVHDHWVDALGDEMIKDFSRAEGDKIEVVGHTVEVYKIIHQDSDNDHILDSTVLHVRSNQGNGGGAHNRDLLGTINVFGDLVTAADIKVEQKNYGIVPTIAQLDEALKPRVYTAKNDYLPPPAPTVDDGIMPENGILRVPGALTFTGEEDDHIEVVHYSELELAAGTIAFNFNADGVAERRALFSKDASGQDSGGHLTAFVQEGRVKVRFQSITRSVWLESEEGSIEPGVDYHVAITFGPDGFFLYLNGHLEEVEAEFNQGLDTNQEALVIGASIWGRSADNPDYARDHFDGEIMDFTVFKGQYDANQVAVLAGEEEPYPIFVNPTVLNGVLYGTDNGETLDAGAAGVHAIIGSYGDDTIVGSSGNDQLQGGHGKDEIRGGAGNDFIISYADSREPVIAQDYGRDDDPENEIDPNTRTLYPDQPIEGDDILIGGPGADTFHFRVLINAKRHIILKHVRDNGEINWDGVAGENNNVHDHWVDGLGDELIMDFSREEGDKIEVVGHTVEVYKVVHQDSDGDNILDSTVLHIRSNQGNGGGAHNRDLLGTINVFGDLVTAADYEVEQENYGIVPTIAQLDEAITPRVYTKKDDGLPPSAPEVDDGRMPKDGVLYVPGGLVFTGERDDHIEVDHYSDLELPQGTVALRFSVDGVGERRALFSKDASGQDAGGHLTAFVWDGRVKVRFQSISQSLWLESVAGSVRPGQEYHLAVTFGPAGYHLYLDGSSVDVKSAFTQNWVTNQESLVVGASIWGRSADDPDYARDHFRGEIRNFTVHHQQYDEAQIVALINSPEFEPDPEPRPLLAHWAFEGNARDLSGNQNHGLLIGPGQTLGASGQAYDFDGNNDCIAIENLYFSEPGVLKTMSVSAWVRSSFSGNGAFSNWAILDYDRSEYFSVFIRGDNGKLGFSTADSNGMIHDAYGKTSINDGEWHFVTVVYDGVDKILFIDGQEDGRELNPHGGLGIGTGEPRFGFIADGSEAEKFNGMRNYSYFSGVLDEIKLYSSVLSTSEILAEYRDTKVEDPSDFLLSSYAFEGDTTDGSGNGNHGKNHGVTFSSGKNGQAANFDGTSNYVAIDNLHFSDAGELKTLTVSGWVNTSYQSSDWTGNWAILDFDRNEYFSVYVRGDTGRVGFSTSDSLGRVQDFFGETKVNDGQWHFICCVYNGRDKIIYVNGQEDHRTGYAHQGLSLGSGRVTRYGFIGDGSEATIPNGDRNRKYFEGSLDEIRLYGAALSNMDIVALYDRFRGQVSLATSASNVKNAQFGGSGSFGISNVFSGTIYEDAEDGTVNGWHVYRNGKVLNIEGGVGESKRAIQTIGKLETDVFRLGKEDGSDWNNSNDFMAEFSIAVSKGTKSAVYFEVETNEGIKYLVYTVNLEAEVQNPNLIYVDLGDIADGGWHRIQRDLEADVKAESTTLVLLKINNLYVYGNLKLDDVILY